MKNKKIKNFFDKFIIFCLIALMGWGVSRLYFSVTGGFRVGKISSSLDYNPDFEVRYVSKRELAQVDDILSQPYRYLGKGCQSYVFESNDGMYVIKFVKFQHFKPKPWVEALSFIPSVESYRLNKIKKKRQLLSKLFKSWILAYEELPDETGVVYLHLNKTKGVHNSLEIYDKMGMKHTLDIDSLEFMIQKRAVMLKETIHQGIAEGKEDEVKRVLSNLLSLMVREHKQGYTDKDHALLQNTGIIDGKPVHVDVGQIVKDQSIKNPKVYQQEIFNKTWRFRIWLEKNYPELLAHLNQELLALIGDQFHKMKYYPKLK